MTFALLAALALALPPASSSATEFDALSQPLRLLIHRLPAAEVRAVGPARPALGVYRVRFESLLQETDSEAVRRAAQADPGLKILVDKKRRELRLMRGDEVLLTAPVAVGSGKTFESNGRRFEFDTPIGKRIVRGKQSDPTWVPPDWHYYERGKQLGLEVVPLRRGLLYPLSGGRALEVRGEQVGLVDEDGEWAPMLGGEEIVFDGKLFIPPFGTEHRRQKGVLGPYKLDMGEGFLIHGTNKGNERSIGQAASHGCVRMANDRLTEIYPLVPVGTPVYIY